jgi:hypothetical protein
MDRNALRPPIFARRFGYLIAVAVNAAILYAANVWPGWRAVPFLTEATLQVLWLVNVSLAVALRRISFTSATTARIYDRPENWSRHVRTGQEGPRAAC